MKHFSAFIFILLIFSCSNPDEDIRIDDQPIVEEPEQPNPVKPVKLPKTIEYRYTNLLDSIFYQSDNHYTYDHLNRITKIVINSAVNEKKSIDYEYNIIYKDTISLAKGFEIKTYDYKTLQTKNEFIELEYIENPNDFRDTVYYNYVNGLAEINDNIFDKNINQVIEGSLHENIFYPQNCGSNLFANIKRSHIQVNQNGYYHVEYVDFTGWVQKGRKFGIHSESVKKSAFLDAKFDYTFWTFFLQDQFFQYETGFVPKWIISYEFIQENLRTISFSPDDELSTYIDNKYPTYRKYSGKYWEQVDDLKSNYEYGVTYY